MYKIILKLEELNTEFDKNILTTDKLKLHLKNHQKEFDDTYSNFISNFENDSKFNIAKDYLNEMKNSFSNLGALLIRPTNLEASRSKFFCVIRKPRNTLVTLV